MADSYGYESKTTDVAGIFIFAAGVANITAFGILVWQGFTYLHSGSWPAMPVLKTLYSMGLDWAAAPQSWYGIYKIIEDISLAGGMVILSLLFYFASLIFTPYNGR
jgi:hypothetical protein